MNVINRELMKNTTDLLGYSCKNFKTSDEILLSGRFDIYNPCSWCKNRKHLGPRGAIFHYVEYGRWEFPYIAESNCMNFSLISSVGERDIDQTLLKMASTIHQQRDHIAEIGKHFSENWYAFNPKDVDQFMGYKLYPGKIIYPKGLSVSEFYREVISLRSDFFDIKISLKELSKYQKNKTGISDSLEIYIYNLGKQMGLLNKEIDYLESSKKISKYSVIQKGTITSVLGSAAWDGFKLVGNTLCNILNI
jgi:hypothetical protein